MHFSGARLTGVLRNAMLRLLLDLLRLPGVAICAVAALYKAVRLVLAPFGIREPRDGVFVVFNDYGQGRLGGSKCTHCQCKCRNSTDNFLNFILFPLLSVYGDRLVAPLFPLFSQRTHSLL